MVQHMHPRRMLVSSASFSASVSVRGGVRAGGLRAAANGREGWEWSPGVLLEGGWVWGVVEWLQVGEQGLGVVSTGGCISAALEGGGSATRALGWDGEGGFGLPGGGVGAGWLVAPGRGVGFDIGFVSWA